MRECLDRGDGQRQISGSHRCQLIANLPSGVGLMVRKETISGEPLGDGSIFG